MTLEQMEFIVAVKREGTILAAAQKLNISHPSISRAISNLERELGVNIFTRTRSGTVVTPEGEAVIESAQRILNEVVRMRDGAHKTPEKEHISIAAFPIDSMAFLPGLIRSFRDRCSYVVINLAQAGVSEIIAKIKTQQINFGIAAIPKDKKGVLTDEIAKVLLFESHLSIACSSTTALAQRPYVTPEEVLQYPLILHDDAVISDTLEHIFGPDLAPNVLMYSNDNSLIKQMVAGGQALSIYTSFLAQSDPKIASGDIKLIPLRSGSSEDTELALVGYMLIYSKRKQLSQAERLFVQMLKDHTRQWR